MIAGELDRAQHQHLRAGRRQLEHLLVRQGVELARPRHESRIGREHALDVGVDLARVGLERGGQRDGRRVRAAAAERRHLERRRDALEAGDEHDRALVERRRGSARGRISRIFARVCAVSVTIPACEPVSEIARVAEVDDRHRRERARDSLAGRQQHVELARVGAGEIGEPERRARPSPSPSPRARRRRRCPLPSVDEPPRDRLQALRPRHGRAAELLDDEAHGEDATCLYTRPTAGCESGRIGRS